MAVFSAAKKARLDVSPQTVQITFMTLLYHPEFACATLLFSPNHVTFYSNLTDVEVMMPPTSEALQSTDPASPKTPALPEGSDRDYFNSPQPLNDGWTCSCGNIWQASVSCDNRDWVNEGRKVGRSRNTRRRADRPQMMADEVKRGGKEGRGRGDCKRDRRSICGIDNMVSAPRWGDVTGWQVGCCCLCRWLGDQGRHAEIPATQAPGSEAYDCNPGCGDTWTHSGTYKHTRLCTYTLCGCKVTSPIANYRHSASISSWVSKLHGSTTTRAMCPAVICQTNYLSWACNCSENRYSGNCVVSCNVKWCFPSISRQDERSKDCSAEKRGSIWPRSQTRSLKIYAKDESRLFEGKRTAPWC